MNDHPSPSSLTGLNDQLASNNLREKSVERLSEGLEATHSFYDVRTDTVVTTPDYRTRLATAVAVLAYTDGRPVERREVVTKHSTSLEELREQAKSSPELRKALRELLDGNTDDR